MEKNINLRTAEEWQAIIMKLPEDWRHKAVAAVKWDFSPKTPFVHNEWFCLMLEDYNRVEHELSREDLVLTLKALGYKAGRIKEITKMKYWDKKERTDTQRKKARDSYHRRKYETT